MSESGLRTDDELAAVDVCALLVTDLPAVAGRSAAAASAGRLLFGDAAIAAAIAADRAGVQPRSLVFLAEVVRRGGVPYAAALPEPLPTPAQAALAHAWLVAANGTDPTDAATPGAGANIDPGGDLDQALAQWLRSVAVIVEARQAARRSAPER